MRQKMVAIGDDFWIEDDQGQKAFKVDGKALRVRDTLKFEDAHGNELCKIQERMLRVKDSMEIEGPGGERLAMVKKAIITPVRDRWTVKIGNGPDLDVQGNILDHESRQGRRGLEEVVSRARFLWRGHRPGSERRADPGHHSLHRPDGSSRKIIR
jgi:uncharacterized protein YxjI